MIKKSISLLNNEPGHDKVYYLQIVDGTVPNTYTVSFQYGKNGGKLKWGNRDGSQKCENVALWAAEGKFNSLLHKQLKKGYHVIPDPEDLMTLIGFSF